MNNGSHLFTPASTFRRVNREWLINLAGGRALLMELAHPLVAAGVAEHSNFAQAPLRRLWRTWRVMTQISFGNASAQRLAIADFYACHTRVHGRLQSTNGAYAAGCPYHAHDPELKLWVLATLIDSALVAYENMIAPLLPAEKEAYFEESKRVAECLGLSVQTMPRTYDEFQSYMASMATSERLYVGADARRIVDALFTTRLLRPLTLLMRDFGVGLLPPRLREGYQFHWQASDEARLQRAMAGLRCVRKHLPELLCVNPHVWLSELR